jgi:hypothetical protein
LKRINGAITDTELGRFIVLTDPDHYPIHPRDVFGRELRKLVQSLTAMRGIESASLHYWRHATGILLGESITMDDNDWESWRIDSGEELEMLFRQYLPLGTGLQRFGNSLSISGVSTTPGVFVINAEATGLTVNLSRLLGDNLTSLVQELLESDAVASVDFAVDAHYDDAIPMLHIRTTPAHDENPDDLEVTAEFALNTNLKDKFFVFCWHDFSDMIEA